MARVYAGWGFSQAFYREKLDLKMSFASLEDFLIGFWEGLFLPRDANNLLAMLWTWQKGDVSANALYNGDFERALGATTARAIVMPGRTNLYFPPEDNEYEVSRMPKPLK
jgi:homoserine O-acetyltransferase